MKLSVSSYSFSAYLREGRLTNEQLPKKAAEMRIAVSSPYFCVRSMSTLRKKNSSRIGAIIPAQRNVWNGEVLRMIPVT